MASCSSFALSCLIFLSISFKSSSSQSSSSSSSSCLLALLLSSSCYFFCCSAILSFMAFSMTASTSMLPINELLIYLNIRQGKQKTKYIHHSSSYSLWFLMYSLTSCFVLNTNLTDDLMGLNFLCLDLMISFK